MVPGPNAENVLFELQGTNEGRFFWVAAEAQRPGHRIRLRPDTLQ
jgi:hypothetical protein